MCCNCKILFPFYGTLKSLSESFTADATVFAVNLREMFCAMALFS